jgi:hypothetical protein
LYWVVRFCNPNFPFQLSWKFNSQAGNSSAPLLFAAKPKGKEQQLGAEQ